MSAVNYDLAIEQGATYNLTFEWRQDDGSNPPTGPFMDTTNYDAYMQIKTKAIGGAVILDLDSTGVAGGITVSNGTITLRIGADKTTTMTSSGVYDLELHNRTDPTDVVRLAQGKANLSTQVTTTPESEL